MCKIIIIFLFSYILIGCSSESNNTNLHKFNSNYKYRLTDENIMEDFLKYWVTNNNLNNTDTFVTYIINIPSAIQQYYYIEIMHLLTGEYRHEDFVILRDLVYEEGSNFILPIMLFILENSDVLTEEQTNNIKKDAELHIEASDIYSKNFFSISEYIYSTMILNEIEGHSTSEALEYLYNKLNHKGLELERKIVYIYYITLLSNNYSLDNSYLYNTLNEILLNYNIENKNLTEIYYLSHLINYYNIDNNLGIYNINFLELLVPDLHDVYLRLSIYNNLNILDNEVKSQLVNYYTAIYDKEKGFGSFVYYTDSNLNYYIYLLLGNMLDIDLPRFPVLDKQVYSKRVNLQEKSFASLLAISLLQLEELGEIKPNMKDEVILRFSEVSLDDSGFNQMYYLLLISYYGGFTDIALESMGLNKSQLEIKLIEYLENSLKENDIVYTIKYLDILTLFYPDNNNIDNLFYKVRSLFYNYIEENNSKTDDIYSSFALLKTIEHRIDKFDNNKDIINEIFDKAYVENFLIIHSWHTKNLKSYYLYYYVSQLYNNQDAPSLNFLFLY